jgi:hypothetical protein
VESNNWALEARYSCGWKLISDACDEPLFYLAQKFLNRDMFNLGVCNIVLAIWYTMRVWIQPKRSRSIVTCKCKTSIIFPA